MGRQSTLEGADTLGSAIPYFALDQPSEIRSGQPPCTLHPAPCTLHPAPCTLNPAPFNMHVFRAEPALADPLRSALKRENSLLTTYCSESTLSS